MSILGEDLRSSPKIDIKSSWNLHFCLQSVYGLALIWQLFYSRCWHFSFFFAYLPVQASAIWTPRLWPPYLPLTKAAFAPPILMRGSAFINYITSSPTTLRRSIFSGRCIFLDPTPG